MTKLNPKEFEAGKVILEAFGSKWLVVPFKGLQSLEQDPFWWIKEAGPGEGNLEYSSVTVDGIKIPCLTNPGPIDAATQLCVVPRDRAAVGEGEDSQPKKKAKKAAR